MEWTRKAISRDKFEEQRTLALNSLYSIKEKIDELRTLMEAHNEMKNKMPDPFDTWGYEFITETSDLEEANDSVVEAIGKLNSLLPQNFEDEEEVESALSDNGTTPYFNPSTDEK
jgi:hypothetical protein